VLEQVSVCARIERVQDPALVPVRGQHDDPDQRQLVHDLPGGADPVQHRHPEIHQDHVRLLVLGEVHRLLPVGGRPDHLDVRGGREELLQPLPDDGVVVHDQQPDHGVGSSRAGTVPFPGSTRG